MKLTHTTGPLSVQKAPVNVRADFTVIKGLAPVADFHANCGTTAGRAEALANAHLFTVAGDLLATLEEMLMRFEQLRELGGFSEHSDLAVRSNALIKKARGTA